MGRLSRNLALLALLWPAVLSAQQRAITGRVADALTGQPLASVAVTVVETRLTSLADAEGRFRLAGVPSDRVTLRLSSAGLQDDDARGRARDAERRGRLEVDALNLDALVVTGQATTIDRRSATTSIAYVSGEEVTRVSLAHGAERA